MNEWDKMKAEEAAKLSAQSLVVEQNDKPMADFLEEINENSENS